jgi:hypothetical protein
MAVSLVHPGRAAASSKDQRTRRCSCSGAEVQDGSRGAVGARVLVGAGPGALQANGRGNNSRLVA